MSVNFYLDRKQMFKEVEQCILLDRLDTLMSFCNSCSFKVVKNNRIPECNDCRVQRGIKAVRKKKEEQKLSPKRAAA
jgi:hypothetical protein